MDTPNNQLDHLLTYNNQSESENNSKLYGSLIEFYTKAAQEYSDDAFGQLDLKEAAKHINISEENANDFHEDNSIPQMQKPEKEDIRFRSQNKNHCSKSCACVCNQKDKSPNPTQQNVAHSITESANSNLIKTDVNKKEDNILYFVTYHNVMNLETNGIQNDLLSNENFNSSFLHESTESSAIGVSNASIKSCNNKNFDNTFNIPLKNFTTTDFPICNKNELSYISEDNTITKKELLNIGYGPNQSENALREVYKNKNSKIRTSENKLSARSVKKGKAHHTELNTILSSEVVIMRPFYTLKNPPSFLEVSSNNRNENKIDLGKYFDTSAINIPMLSECVYKKKEKRNKRKQTFDIVLDSNLKFEVHLNKMHKYNSYISFDCEDPYPENELPELNDIFKRKKKCVTMAFSKRSASRSQSICFATSLNNENLQTFHKTVHRVPSSSFEEKVSIVKVSESDSESTEDCYGSIKKLRLSKSQKCDRCNKIFKIPGSLAVHSKQCKWSKNSKQRSSSKISFCDVKVAITNPNALSKNNCGIGNIRVNLDKRYRPHTRSQGKTLIL